VHELGLATAVVGAIEQRAKGRPVARVRLHVGRLQRVEPGSFDLSFAVAAMGTVAEGASAEVVYEDVVVRCESCGAQTEATEMPPLCPGCGGAGLLVVSGDQLVLESLEYRAP